MDSHLASLWNRDLEQLGNGYIRGPLGSSWNSLQLGLSEKLMNKWREQTLTLK